MGEHQGGPSKAGLGQMQRETSVQLSVGHLSGKVSWIGNLGFGHLKGIGIFSDFGEIPGKAIILVNILLLLQLQH